MGKYLRVRVLVNVTKKLIQGKQVIIDGAEGRGVYFKYERLPNFYYKCGLLSHELRDCAKIEGSGNQLDLKNLQNGAWLRGEIIRKPVRESFQNGNKEAMDKNEDPDKGGGGIPEGVALEGGYKEAIVLQPPEGSKGFYGNPKVKDTSPR